MAVSGLEQNEISEYIGKRLGGRLRVLRQKSGHIPPCVQWDRHGNGVNGIA
ncbi:MAG: hypothetical protein BWY83_02518 [bacterium ADurb.Bin478]|nr:MAG: hypothetical protein BWY83_02518 [bacterium ADurb.Bin478]